MDHIPQKKHPNNCSSDSFPVQFCFTWGFCWFIELLGRTLCQSCPLAKETQGYHRHIRLQQRDHRLILRRFRSNPKMWKGYRFTAKSLMRNYPASHLLFNGTILQHKKGKRKEQHVKCHTVDQNKCKPSVYPPHPHHDSSSIVMFIISGSIIIFTIIILRLLLPLFVKGRSEGSFLDSQTRTAHTPNAVVDTAARVASWCETCVGATTAAMNTFCPVLSLALGQFGALSQLRAQARCLYRCIYMKNLEI